MEQYVYDKITEDEALQLLLTIDSGDVALYPGAVPRGVEFDRAVTFTTIITTDAYPHIKSVQVQFNIFAKTHADIGAISKALYDLFNEDNNNSNGEGEAKVEVVYSQRKTEADIGFNYDDGLYQREATYYFKLR